MKNLLSILSNLTIIGASVSLLLLLIKHAPENQSWGYFIALVIMVCPLTAVILGASNNIIKRITNAPN